MWFYNRSLLNIQNILLIMSKQKKSKKRRHSSYESSSGRSYSSRSQSSQQYKHRSKKNKHKYDQSGKDELKKNKKNKREQKRKDEDKRQQRDRQRQRERLNYQRLPKREGQNNNQRSKQQMKSQYIKREQIYSNNKQQQQGQQHIVSHNSQRGNDQFNNISSQILQQQQKPKKQQPCFEPSGILLEYYNSREGVSLRFHQPPQAREPQDQWRMYVFKGEQVLKPIMLTKSSYLIGKDDRVADILAQNSSISRQHCVIQFRLIQRRQTEGDYLQIIKPYVMDLESTNGTFLNDQRIQSGRYYELLHRDVLKFGFSDRQYVIVKWEGDEMGQQVQDGS